MKKSKITLRLSKLGDADLEARSFGIVAAMTGNAHFPEPTPALADLNNSLKLFSDSLAFAKTGDRVKAILKNQRRDDLELLLTNLANYCSFIAQGDRFILASSGFSLNAETSASKTLADPANFTVEIGCKSGDALAYVNAVPNAKAYLYRWGIAPIANEAWFHTIHSQPYFTITGLVPGTIYSFQIGVAGSKGQTVYTKVISQMVV
jgi:hypothetical protein